MSYAANLFGTATGADGLRWRGNSPMPVNAGETDPLLSAESRVKANGDSGMRMAATCGFVILVSLGILGLAVGGVILANVFATRDDLEIHIGMDVEQLVNNVPDSFINPGFTTPPDTIVAVGDHSIITMVNKAMHIIEKGTFNTIAAGTTNDGFNPTSGGDTHIVWDPLSKRYFFTDFGEICRCTGEAGLSSPGLAEDTCASHTGSAGAPPDPDNTMPPVTTAISGSVVATVPANACGAISNGAAISGNIALIARGTCDFADKVKEAQDVGAIAVVIYDNNAGSTCPPVTMFASDPTLTVPTVMIGNVPGLALAAALPTTATITPDDSPINTTVLVGLGVSKTSDPRTVSLADWHYFKVGQPAWAVPGVLHDYIKIAVDRTRVYITSQDYTIPGYAGSRIVAFDKAAAESGILTFLWAEQLPRKTTGFIYPLENRWPSTDGLYQIQYFYSYNGYDGWLSDIGDSDPVTALRIFHTDPFSASGLPLSSFDISMGDDLPVLATDLQRTQQPLSRTDGSPSPSIDAFALPMTGVYHNGSLWIAHTYQNSGEVPRSQEDPNRESLNVAIGRSAIRWYEIDVSRHLAENIVTTRQIGTVIPHDAGSGLSMPHINVDAEGNMAIGFTVSGVHEYPTVAYTGRHRRDPLNTVRYPIIRANTAPCPYNPRDLYEPGYTRWGDYSGLAVDPVDGKTFYVYGEIGDMSFRIGSDPDHCITWTTGLAQFKFTESTTPPVHRTNPKCKHAHSVEAEVRAAYEQSQSTRKKTRDRNESPLDEFEEEHRVIPFGPFCNKTHPMPAHCKQVMGRMGARAYDNPEKPTR